MIGAEIARLGLRRLNPIRHIEALLKPKPRTAFARVAVLESSLYMRNQLLRDTDWASMAHSLEVRVPLVDIKLLSQLASITARNGSLSKHMLANSPAVPLPARVIERPKTGFETPIQSWMQRDNRVQEWRRVPALAADKCTWARRWAFQVSAAASGSVMARSGLRILALVTDAFGGHGGIAQYNRDFLSALARCDGVGDVIVLPRRCAESVGALPIGVRQLRADGEQAGICGRRALDGNNAQPDRFGLLRPLAHGATGGGHRQSSECSVVGPSPRGRCLARTLGVAAPFGRNRRRSLPRSAAIRRRRLLQWVGTEPSSGEGASKHCASTIPPWAKARLFDRPSCCWRKEGATDGVSAEQLGSIQGP